MRIFQIVRVMSAPFVLALGAILTLSGCGGSDGSNGDPPPTVTAPSNLAYSSPQQYVADQPIIELIPTVTGTVTAYSISPALPSGLLLNATNGHITGTPQQPAAQTTYTVSASNSAGTTTFALTMTILAADSFWIEPKQTSTIGIEQIIPIYGVLQKSTDAYPQYLDAASLTYESSDTSVASIDSDGHVLGIAEGTATISVSDGAHTSQLTVTVSGHMIRRTIAVAGQGNRSYWLYTPHFSAGSSHPLILSLHGGGGSGMLQASMSQLNALASTQGLYIAYLEGTGAIQTFNAGGCCGSAQSQNVDDVLYASKVLDDLDANYAVDASHTFATGFSNGAMMSHRLACSLADRIAGIAAVSGGSAEFDKDGNQYFVCSPQRPIPVLHIHALNDRNYPYAGGPGAGISGSNFYPIDATIHDWVVRNNVTDDAAIEQVTATTTCYRHNTPADTSKPSAPVVLCKLNPPDIFDSTRNIVFGGGHSWPGGVKSPADDSDVPNADFDADAYIWKFFKAS